MLDKLKKCGEDKGYFESKRIRDFCRAEDEGIGKINTEAIEFDKTKDKIHKGGDKPPSVDALDIVCSRNKIIFIEFKRLCREKEDFEKELMVNLIKKTAGSIETLRRIMEECGIPSNFGNGFVLSYYFSEKINLSKNSEKINELGELLTLMALKELKRIDSSDEDELGELLKLTALNEEKLNKLLNFLKKIEFIEVGEFDEEYKKFRDQT